MPNIKICYAPDNNYAIPCSISIQSVMNTISNDISVKFLILDGGLTDDNKNIITQIIGLHKNAIVEFVKVNDKEFSEYYTEAWKTSATYRFKIDSLLKNYDKVLYLDCDIIVNKSIAELYNIDLGNNIIAMVPDIWYKKQNTRFPKKKQPYFNTGVCLFNLELFRKENISEKLISYYKTNQASIIYPDQDPINVILDNRILELDYKYNWCWNWDKNEYFEEHGVTNIEDAVIIHYIFNKPWWSTNIHIASEKYFDIIKTIPREIRKKYSSFKERRIIAYKYFYLFCLLPIFKISNCYTTEYWSIINIPVLKIKRNNNTNKYYLFNLIPVFKVKQVGNLEKQVKFVKALGKY